MASDYYDNNFGEGYYESYADTFKAQFEHDADERDHEREQEQDRLRRDWPTSLSHGELVRLFVARGFDLADAKRMADERKAA